MMSDLDLRLRVCRYNRLMWIYLCCGCMLVVDVVGGGGRRDDILVVEGCVEADLRSEMFLKDAHSQINIDSSA